MPEYTDAPSKTTEYTDSVSPTPYVKVRLFAEMDVTKKKVSNLKYFYERLPEELCVVDEISAKQADFENCWNGQSVAR